MCTRDSVPRALTHPVSIGRPGCGAQEEMGVGKPSQGDPGPDLRAGESGQAASCTRVGRAGRWGTLERLKQAEVPSDS